MIEVFNLGGQPLLVALITGDRNWRDRRAIRRVLENLLIESGMNLLVIEGCARGADGVACYWRRQSNSVTHQHFPAQWETYGRAAGPIRNSEMAKFLLTFPYDIRRVYAFHDYLTSSRGTYDMLSKVKRQAPVIKLIRHKVK